MRFSHQGNAREDGSKAKSGSAPNPRAHLSMVREEEEVEEEGRELFWSQNPPHRSQAATVENNELTSRLVTSRENMAAAADTPQMWDRGSNTNGFMLLTCFYSSYSETIFY